MNRLRCDVFSCTGIPPELPGQAAADLGKRKSLACLWTDPDGFKKKTVRSVSELSRSQAGTGNSERHKTSKSGNGQSIVRIDGCLV